MIYHLFQYFEKLGWDIPGMGLMHYLSFRAMMATVAAVLFAMLAGKRIIRLLQRHQIGDVPRDLGLAGNELKKGVPTMGGIIIILSILTGVLQSRNNRMFPVILCRGSSVGRAKD